MDRGVLLLIKHANLLLLSAVLNLTKPTLPEPSSFAVTHSLGSLLRRMAGQYKYLSICIRTSCLATSPATLFLINLRPNSRCSTNRCPECKNRAINHNISAQSREEETRCSEFKWSLARMTTHRPAGVAQTSYRRYLMSSKVHHHHPPSSPVFQCLAAHSVDKLIYGR